MRRTIVILISFLSVLCLICSLIGGAAYFFRPKEKAGPAVIIKSPTYGEKVSSEKPILIQAVARDPSGVIRVELWSGRELMVMKTSQLPQGSNPFPFVVGWQPRGPGHYTLVVRAYNSAQQSGQASIVVEALEAPKPVPIAHEVKEGETLESIATEYGVSPQDIAANNPGLKEPLEPGKEVLIPPPRDEDDARPPEEAPPEPLPREEPPEPAEHVELPPLWGLPGRLFPLPFPEIPWIPSPRIPLIQFISLEVEGVYLEVDKDYNGVYCYVSLAGLPIERVSEDGYLEGLGEHRWNIEAQMGGENKRTVLVPKEESRLDVMVNCIGYNESAEGGIIFDLGTLTASHFEEEWDGRLIEKSVTGLHGWFKVGYRINLSSPPPPLIPRGGELVWPPTNVAEGAILGWSLGLYFDYPTGAEENIDGYLIYRNGALLAEITDPLLTSRYPDHNRWFAPIRQSDFYPSCPDRYEFYMTAYRDTPEGRLESDRSNSVFIDPDPVPCYRSKVVRVTPQTLGVGCLDVDPYRSTLCTKGQAGSLHQRMTGGTCDCTHDPLPFPIGAGHASVNGEKVLDVWSNLESGIDYEIVCDSTGLCRSPELGAVGKPALLTLGPFDDLTITMDFWDDDVFSRDDHFCRGNYTIPHWELDEIAKSEERKKTYIGGPFSGGDGTCWLEFTVEVVVEFEE